jgi:hypothetical protein
VDCTESLADWLGKVLPLKSDKGKEKEAKETMFEYFTGCTNATAKFLPNNKDKKTFAEAIVNNISKIQDPFYCLKFGEVSTVLFFLETWLFELFSFVIFLLDVVSSFLHEQFSEREK